MPPSLVTVSGSITKGVRCGSCGHKYEYELNRTAVGSYSGFAVSQAEVEKRAEENAQQELKKLLGTDIDIVPCPNCGELTARMKREQDEAAGQAFIAGISLLGISLLIVVGVYCVGKWFGRWYYVLGIIGILGVIFSVVVLLAASSEIVLRFWKPKNDGESDAKDCAE